MFSCKSCAVLQDQITHLRGLVDKMSDKLVALANPAAFGVLDASTQTFDPRNYWGNDHDELVAYDAYGQKIVGQKDPLAE